jgi:hypothetical protein
MPKKYFTAEQMISKLRNTEVLLNQGNALPLSSLVCISLYPPLERLIFFVTYSGAVHSLE